MPSSHPAIVGGAFAILAFSNDVGAQGPGPEPGLGIGARFLIALLVYLTLGLSLVVLGPRYAREMVAKLDEDPGVAFGWGLLVGIGVPIALVLIALTIIGLLVAIPGIVALFVVGLVGTAVAVVWVGELVTGADGEIGAGTAAIGAVVLAIPAAIPVLGDLIVSIIGLFGLGVVSKELYEAWRE